MNRTLYTLIGGNFVELDDFEFDQLGVAEAFEGRLSFYQDVTLAAEGFIISGCGAVLGGGNFTISPGFIALKGEVFRVAAQVIPDDAGKTFFWAEDITFDPAGTEDFEDASTQETYEIRRVKLFSATVPPADIMPFDRVNPSDPSLTQEKLVIRQQFSEGINTTGTSLLTTIIPIGTWDMDVNANVSVPHTIAVNTIRSATVIILSNFFNLVHPLDAFASGVSQGGIAELRNTPNNILLGRLAGGLFDGVNYNGAANRGYITITHEA